MGVIFYGSGGKLFNNPPKYDAFFCPCGVKKLSVYQLRKEKNKNNNIDLTEDQIRILYVLAKSSRGINNRILATANHRYRHNLDNSKSLTWGWLRSRRGYDLERLGNFLATSISNKDLWLRLIDNDSCVNEIPIEGLETLEELQKDKDCWSDLIELPINPRNHSPSYVPLYELQSVASIQSEPSIYFDTFTDYELYLFDQM